MWFVFLGIGFALLLVGGLYVRRRITGALTHLGIGSRWVRVVRWAIAWLLYGYPLIMLVGVLVSVLAGRETIPRFDGPIATWLLVYPFFIALLVMVQSLPYMLLIELVHWPMRRRTGAAGKLRTYGVLAVVGAFTLYTPIRIIAEHETLRVREHKVGAAAATTSRPLRISFIADLQQDGHTDLDRAAQVVGLVNAASPDLVLSGGDWINTGPDYIAAAAVTAGALRSRLGTYSVRGDHEHFGYIDRERSVREVEQALAAYGVAMVTNQVRWFEHEGKRIAIVFLAYNYIVRADARTIASLMAEVASADYSIVVTHQLDAALAALLEDKVDLVLGAHTHGGQINPVLGVVHVPLARLETEYIDGRYALGTTTVIVTAGVGFSLVPFRYAAPPSIELIELRL